MGWDGEDISLIDDELPANHSEDIEDLTDSTDQPYTLHKHPVFIVTKSLYKYIKQSWEHLLKNNTGTTAVELSPELSWNFAKSLHNGELNVLLAIQALDLGDYGLAICHLKNSLSELNQSLKLLDELSSEDLSYLEAFTQELKIRIFDLRELWIRVMNDCRHESQRRSDNKDAE